MQLPAASHYCVTAGRPAERKAVALYAISVQQFYIAILILRNVLNRYISPA